MLVMIWQDYYLTMTQDSSTDFIGLSVIYSFNAIVVESNYGWRMDLRLWCKEKLLSVAFVCLLVCLFRHYSTKTKWKPLNYIKPVLGLWPLAHRPLQVLQERKLCWSDVIGWFVPWTVHKLQISGEFSHFFSHISTCLYPFLLWKFKNTVFKMIRLAILAYLATTVTAVPVSIFCLYFRQTCYLTTYILEKDSSSCFLSIV